MAVTMKVAGCPGTIISCETGWPVIIGGSTAEGGREGGRDGRREGRKKGEREGGREREGGIKGSKEGGRIFINYSSILLSYEAEHVISLIQQSNFLASSYPCLLGNEKYMVSCTVVVTDGQSACSKNEVP